MSKNLQVGHVEELSGEQRVAAENVDRPEAAGVAGSVLASLLEPAELRAWWALLTRHARVTRRLETALVARSNLQLELAEYDALLQLALAEGQRLRMSELADRALLSRAGISRLVDRLIADGLVSRTKCPSDARGYFAALTASGLARLETATPDYMAATRRFFLEAFTVPELGTLAELLERSQPLD